MEHIDNVLLIDDEPIFNLIHREIVKTAKSTPRVSSCSNANEALDELHTRIRVDYEEFPDIILLDINMPKKDGWAFLEEFKKFPEWSLKKCKIFVLSSCLDQIDIEKSKRHELVYDFIPKPLTVDKYETICTRQKSIAT